MAFTANNDINILQSSDAAVVGAGAGNDTYVLSPSTLSANQEVTISDTQGSNKLQLIDGLTIASSTVASNAVLLTLSNGAKVKVLGADTFSYEVGGNPLTATTGTVQTYAQFATTTLGAASVPTTTGTTAAGTANVTIAGGSTGTTAGQAFSLTSSATADAPVLTAGNDTVTGALGTIADTDRIIDSSVTDGDIFNATLNTATAKPQVINIETMNVTGEYITTGYDFANSVGIKTANFATGITGGTVTTSNVSATRVTNINAGNNVSSLTVTDDITGSAGTVYVNTGSAATVTVGATGANTGNDVFDITLGTAATSLTLEANGTGAASTADAFTVKLVGNTLTTFLTSGSTLGEIETLTLNSTGAANAVTLTNTSGDLIVGTTTGNKAIVTGNTALTLTADWDNLTGTVIENTNTAGFTVKTTSTIAGTTDLKAVAANVAQVSVSQGAQDIKVNEATTLKLSADNLISNGGKGYNVDNAAGTLTTGTLKVDLAIGQANVATLAKVATLDISANTVDATIGNLLLNDATSTVKLSGSKQVTLTYVSDLGTTDDTLITASTMTGKLILTDTSADKMVVVSGSGNDSLTITSAKADSVVRGGDGADTIIGATLGSLLFGDAGNDTITAGTAASVVDGGAGNDTLNGNANADTISGGDGDDVIDGKAGADIITGGTGADKFVTANASTTVYDWVKDFVVGTDKIVLSASNTTAISKLIDLTALSTTNQAAVDTAFVTSMAAAVDSVMSNKGSGYGASADSTAEGVTFKVGTDTYLFINLDATTDAGASWLDATDFVVKLTGVTGTLTTADILVS